MWEALPLDAFVMSAGCGLCVARITKVSLSYWLEFFTLPYLTPYLALEKKSDAERGGDLLYFTSPQPQKSKTDLPIPAGQHPTARLTIRFTAKRCPLCLEYPQHTAHTRWTIEPALWRHQLPKP